VAAALQTAGLRCGTLTSPHVERVNERLRLLGAPADDDVLATALEAAMVARATAERRDSAGGSASWFDVFIAASLWSLANDGASWAVVECGLGGRGDSTNVLDAEVSVLTSVELEHTEVLGHTVEEIAREKAGIVSPAGTLVAALAHGSAGADVATSVARERGASALVLVPPPATGAAASNLLTARAVLDELGRRGVRCAAGRALGSHLLDDPAVLALALSMLPMLSKTSTPHGERVGTLRVRRRCLAGWRAHACERRGLGAGREWANASSGSGVQLVQAVSPMNRLALSARESLKNGLSEVRDPRRSLRDSMDHVTGVLFRPKSKPVWSWWYSPREFVAKEAPQAAKSTIFELLDPKLPRKAG